MTRSMIIARLFNALISRESELARRLGGMVAQGGAIFILAVT